MGPVPASVVTNSGHVSNIESSDRITTDAAVTDPRHLLQTGTESDDSKYFDDLLSTPTNTSVTYGVPKHLLEVSGTVGSNDSKPLNTLPSTATSTSMTAGREEDSVDYVFEIRDPHIRLPTYLGNQLTCKLGTHANATIIQLLFAEPLAGDATSLVVHKPYLHYLLQPAHSNRIASKDEAGPKANSAIIASSDLDEMHTPPEDRFEE